MKTQWILLTALTFLVSTSVLAAGEAKEPFGSLTVDEVSKKLEQKGAYIFDANSLKVFGEGHVSGAVNLPGLKYPESILPKDKNATLIFYCKNEQCTASHEAAKQAAKYGYKNLYIMSAGIDGWAAAGKPVEKSAK
jgi:rhodanese-related sulfurtransferase